MAKSGAVWGIDIGQCALKALKCRPHEKEPRQLVVESFDFIEYPKILSQPEADPAELVREALEQFLSRNDLTGDLVAMSVPGQSGLSRFIKLPPVEAKKIPDIVKYEARQQIPFSLDDVVWDYQQLTGGSEEDGFALEPEVGLFAMKRDQVARALAPLEAAGIEVDLIQLAPLSVYNYVCFDRLEELKTQKYDPSKPPASTVVLSLGTDTTDLVVTNGFRVWQRSIPIGGNHFTRALSKELKLTFVKAEHLKRHATQADDPKAVFQAMRPVFSDLLAEIQRSLGYFQSLDKAAHIGDVIALGNAMKLPGLQRYLAQNLEQEVRPIEEFDRLVAGSASGNAAFKDNILSFAPAYGLCIQALGKSELRTNLLPEEIVRKRLIRAKKPWAVAGAAAILAGLTFNYLTLVSTWKDANVADQAWSSAISQADSVKSTADGLEATRASIHTAVETISTIQTNLTKNVEGRLVWLEMLKGLEAAMPREERPREEDAEHVMSRNELHVTAIDGKDFDDLPGGYFSLIETNYNDSKGKAAAGADAGGDPALAADPAAAPVDAAVATDPSAAGAQGAEAPAALEGKGWVIQLTGYHFHNSEKDLVNQQQRFVENTLIKSLEEGFVELPDGYDPATGVWTGELVKVPIKDLGISRPWVVAQLPLKPEVIDPEADLRSAGGGAGGEFGMRGGYEGRPGGGEFGAGVPGAEGEATLGPDGKPAKPRWFKVQRYDFVVQFCWQPKTRTERREIARQRAEAEAAAAEAAAAEAAAGEGAVTDGGEPPTS
jgi:type IV pilus assembly protein PilM